jgi:2-polyprenyl-6-methoxyphenol hydroxylase-like FAD-dependent oxidoreductase
LIEFTKLFADFHRDALDLMHAISPGTLFKWGLRDREPLQHYTKGRVTMLGDAAHPMTPFLGQGACVAIEDAMVLGRAFAAASTFEQAFGTYENTRKERANGVQLASREQANEIQGVTKRGPNPGQPPMIAACICIIPSQHRSPRRARCLQRSNRWFGNQTAVVRIF